MQTKKAHLIVISAPSGAGKTTLCKKLLNDYALSLSISSTTRAPRGTERHGIEYFFLTPDDFKKGIKDGSFVEWAQVHENYYGTSKKFLTDQLNTGKSVLLDIDVQGAEQLRNSFPNHCKRIFIAPPNLEVLNARLRSRGTDSEESIQKRMKNAVMEIEEGNKFDHIVVNDALDRAYDELKKIMAQLQIESRQTLSSQSTPNSSSSPVAAGSDITRPEKTRKNSTRKKKNG